MEEFDPALKKSAPPIWDELVRVALIGTNRSKLSPPVEDAITKLGVSDKIEAPQQVLEGAAFYQVALQAGRKLPIFEGDLQQDPAGTPDRVCSVKVGQLLQRILDGAHAPVLPEFVRLMQTSEMVLPPESLPQLLEQAILQPPLWQEMEPLIGSRGKWLLQQHPVWKTLDSQHSIRLWEEGKSEERLALLSTLRRNDPAKATELLLKTWRTESTAFKTAAIELLSVGLQTFDLELLERALQEGRKEVRHAAALLALHFPDHPLTREMQAFVEPQLQWDGTKLTVHLAEDLPENFTRLGLYPDKTKAQQGLRASRLEFALSCVDPDFWELAWGLDPYLCLKVFQGQEQFEMVLVRGLAQAIVRFKRQDWASVFLQQFLLEEQYPQLEDALLHELVQLIPTTVFQELTDQAIGNRKHILKQGEPLERVLRKASQPWSANLSVLLIDGFKKQLAKLDRSETSWFNWQKTPSELEYYIHLLEQAGIYSPPEVLNALKKDWPTESRFWGLWEQEVQAMIRRVQFRAVLYNELISQ